MQHTGYPLCLPIPICSCLECDDPVAARGDLALYLAELTTQELALLRLPLRRIDQWYANRTLPDPHSTKEHWFERRLTEQQGWGRELSSPFGSERVLRWR
jgi:hypothetical protein